MKKEGRRYYRECREECQELYKRAKQGDREAEMILLKKWSIRIIPTKEYIREIPLELRLEEAEKKYSITRGNYKEIAKEFCLTRGQFRKYLVEKEKLRKRGKSGYEELHPQEAEKIIKEYQQENLMSELSRKYRVHRKTIVKILKRAEIPLKSRSEVQKIALQKGLVFSVRYNPEKRELIRKTYQRLGSIRRTAQVLKIGRNAVTHVLKEPL